MYKILQKETNQSLLSAMSSIFIVLFFTIDIKLSFWILLMVIITDIEIYSVLYLSGISINAVSCIILIIAIGIAVDYSAHIGHSFFHVFPPEHLNLNRM